MANFANESDKHRTAVFIKRTDAQNNTKYVRELYNLVYDKTDPNKKSFIEPISLSPRSVTLDSEEYDAVEFYTVPPYRLSRIGGGW